MSGCQDVLPHFKQILRTELGYNVIDFGTEERALNCQYVFCLDEPVYGGPRCGLFVFRNAECAGWEVEHRINLTDDQGQEPTSVKVVFARVAEYVVILAMAM